MTKIDETFPWVQGSGG